MHSVHLAATSRHCASRYATWYTQTGHEAVKIPQNTAIQTTAILLLTAALRSRCGHYIFALWFLSFFLSSSSSSYFFLA